jgi:hypothetical protein
MATDRPKHDDADADLHNDQRQKVEPPRRYVEV